MVKTAYQLCPKRKCKKKRKRDWTPDMTSIMKKGNFTTGNGSKKVTETIEKVQITKI